MTRETATLLMAAISAASTGLTVQPVLDAEGNIQGVSFINPSVDEHDTLHLWLSDLTDS